MSRLNPKSLADFGCGDGAILFDLHRKGLLNRVNSAIAIDLSETRLERVKKNIANVETICSDVCDVKQPKDNQLDLVICTQVIEHVKDDKKLLNEIYRVLKPGEYLYISSVVKKWYGWWIYRCNGKITCDPTHLREYSSEEEFVELLKRSKYQILDKKLSLFRPSIFNVFKRFLIKYKIINEELIIKSNFCNFLTKFKIPVLGYYIIEVISRK